MLSCGCHGLFFCLRPLPTGGYVGAHRRSPDGMDGSRANHGRGDSATNHGRGGSAAYRGRGDASRARMAPWAAAYRSHAGESYRRDGGRVMGVGSNPGTNLTSRNYHDGGPDGPICHGLNFRPGSRLEIQLSSGAGRRERIRHVRTPRSHFSANEATYFFF